MVMDSIVVLEHIQQGGYLHVYVHAMSEKSVKVLIHIIHVRAFLTAYETRVFQHFFLPVLL